MENDVRSSTNTNIKSKHISLKQKQMPVQVKKGL